MSQFEGVSGYVVGYRDGNLYVYLQGEDSASPIFSSQVYSRDFIEAGVQADPTASVQLERALLERQLGHLAH